MRVLIIGCGYVGLGLATRLARAGHQVDGMQRTEKHFGELQSVGAVPICGDITQPETFARLEPTYDWVVNCVSASGGGPEEYRRVYLNGMQNIVSWLRPSPPLRFVYTSSTSVYGQTDGSIVDEASTVAPAAETAKILVQTEECLLAAARKNEINAVILRLAGIYGPGRGYWLRQFVEGRAQIEGDGRRWLNMVQRDDVVGALAACLERAKAGDIYNVVDDEPVQQLTLFEWMAEALRRPLPPAVEAAAERKRGVSNKRVSNRKLKHELCYQFQYPTFREGFARQLAVARGSEPAGESGVSRG